MQEHVENASSQPITIDVANFFMRDTPSVMAGGLPPPAQCCIVTDLPDVTVNSESLGKKVAASIYGVSDPESAMCYVAYKEEDKQKWVRCDACTPPVHIIDSSKQTPATAPAPAGVVQRSTGLEIAAKGDIEALVANMQIVTLDRPQSRVNTDNWSQDIPNKYTIPVEDRPVVKIFSRKRGAEVAAVVSDVSTDGVDCKVNYGGDYKWVSVLATNPPLRFVFKKGVK